MRASKAEIRDQDQYIVGWRIRITIPTTHTPYVL